MKRTGTTATAAIVLAAGLAIGHAVSADFELTGPDGRRILLKDDGTWRYLDPKDKIAAKAKDKDKDRDKDKDQAKDKPKVAGEATLRIERKTEVSGGSCRFGLRLVNNYPYEVRQFVPAFSAYRSNGAIYESVFAGFFGIKPGNFQTQEVLFRGLPCEDIVRVQVVGGDNCVMGDLDRFSYEVGQCLDRVRVIPSDLVRFDK